MAVTRTGALLSPGLRPRPWLQVPHFMDAGTLSLPDRIDLKLFSAAKL